jgi:hypothetical protein
MKSCKLRQKLVKLFGYHRVPSYKFYFYRRTQLRDTLQSLKDKHQVDICLSIYGSMALCWVLATFQFLNPMHSR